MKIRMILGYVLSLILVIVGVYVISTPYYQDIEATAFSPDIWDTLFLMAAINILGGCLAIGMGILGAIYLLGREIQ